MVTDVTAQDLLAALESIALSPAKLAHSDQDDAGAAPFFAVAQLLTVTDHAGKPSLACSAVSTVSKRLSTGCNGHQQFLRVIRSPGNGSQLLIATGTVRAWVRC